MAEEIKKVISIDTKGAESVKDLIDKVEKLRGILKTLDETSDEYKTTLGELKSAQDSLSSSLGENKTKAEAAEGSYNALAKQMKDLKKEWKATSDEAERNALGKEIKGINDQLKTLDQSIGNNQRNVGNYAGSFQSLKQEIREARDVMAAAARGSDEYAEAAKRAAEASAKLRDMQEEIVKGDAGLDNQFAVTSNLLGSISGGFAAAQGAMALFGAESENLQKTFVKLQAAMSMTQGFKALAELPKGLNAAKIAFGGVTTGVKNFIKGLNGVKGAIAATGIGLLLVLLGELIANWDAVTEAVSNFVGGMDGLTEKLAGVGNVIKNLVTGPLKALHLALKGEWKEAGEAIKQSFSIAANYTEGAARQATKNVQKNLREQAAARAKDLDYQIRMNEAKEGSDWKYTEDAKKMYDEYFHKMLAQYDKNSDEYNEMLIKMEAYNREFTDHQKQEEERRAKELEEARNAAAERARAAAEKEREEYEASARKAFEAGSTELGKEFKALEENLGELDGLVKKAFDNPPFKKYGKEMVAYANKMLDAYKPALEAIFENEGLTYSGFIDTLKKGNEYAILIYKDAVTQYESILGDNVSKIFNSIDVVLNKEGFVFKNYVNAWKDTMTGKTEEANQEAVDIITRYGEMARESMKKGFLNEGDWLTFVKAVRNTLNSFFGENQVKMRELAIELQIPYEKLYEYLRNTAEETSKDVVNLLPEIKDANYKFTEEGQAAYAAYFKDLEKLYENDFDKWFQIRTKKRDYEEELLKHKEEERRKELEKERKDLQLALSYELLDIDKHNLEAQKKADESYWSVVYGEGTWHQVGSFFGFITEESLKFYDQEIELEKQRLENFREGINAQITELEREKNLEITTTEEKKQIEYEIADLKQRLAEETYRVYAKYKDKEEEKAKKVEKLKKSFISSTADLAGNVSEILNDYAQNNVDTNKDAAEKSFKWSKALAYGETWISTLATVQNIIKSFSEMGPWGVAAGVAAGAAALASGIARTAQIANQKLGDTSGGGGSSDIGITSAVAVPQLESTPYQYTSNVTNAADEDELNKPIIVQVSDVEDAMKVRESRNVETSF